MSGPRVRPLSPRQTGPRDAGPGRAGRALGTAGAERVPSVKPDPWCSEPAVACLTNRQTNTLLRRFCLSLTFLGMLSLPCPF